MTHEQEGAADQVSQPTGVSAAWRVAREPAVLAIVVTGLVHVIRRDATDILVFFGLVAVIVVDDVRSGRSPRESRLVSGLSARGILGVCALYALMVLPLSRTGWPMRLLVIVPGLVALLVVTRAVRSPLQDEPTEPPLGRGWLVWPAVVVAICIFELVNFMSQVDPHTDNPRHPTISAIVDPLLTGALPRAVFAAVWLAAGIWLVRAITTRPSVEAATREGEVL